MQYSESIVNKIPGQIFCVFKTNLPEEYKVDETPINIQTISNESALSEIVISLLQAEKGDDIVDENLKFEFLINNDFLRGNLKSHLIKHDMTAEQTLEIQYCFALPQPKEKEQINVEDWVSCIHTLGQTNKPQLYAVSLFNGLLSIYSKDNKLQAQESVYDRAIKSIKIDKLNDNHDKIQVLCACKDSKIRITQYSQKSKQFELVAIADGHQESVESVDYNPIDNSQFCSGSFDGELILWQKDSNDTQNAYQETEKSKKKVKLSVQQINPTSTNRIHHQPITQVEWANVNTIVTASLDHTIKLFDTEKNYDFATINNKDVAITSINSRNNLILSGCNDGYVKIWDTRNKENIKHNTFKSHNTWISSCKFHVNNENVFATSSYDKTIKLWDMRSNFPLHTLKTHKDKVFALDWNGSETLLSGGSDSMVGVYNIN